MPGFTLKAPGAPAIRFYFYKDAAPRTAAAFFASLPLTIHFLHARVSGEEIWTSSGPRLDIPQENASVAALPGEIAIGPVHPERNKVAGLMGIFYGEGKLVDAANIFARVADGDLAGLKELGEKIWKEGGRDLLFEAAEDIS